MAPSHRAAPSTLPCVSLVVRGLFTTTCRTGFELDAMSLVSAAGLHLNLTEGRPVSPAGDVASLLGADGLLRGKTGFREALRRGDVSLDQVTAARFTPPPRGLGRLDQSKYNLFRLSPVLEVGDSSQLVHRKVALSSPSGKWA